MLWNSSFLFLIRQQMKYRGKPNLSLIVSWSRLIEKALKKEWVSFQLVNLIKLLSVNISLTSSVSLICLFTSLRGLVESGVSYLIYVMFILAFLVKLPMYFTHLWLPRAHVEAPVAGSIVLAGVLLKLGGYGLLRVLPICIRIVRFVSYYLVGLRLIGMVYVGVLCCRLNDLKALVAYSSVAHMSMVIRGCVIMNVWGSSGALIMMIGHGLSSSGLFCIVNIFYERISSRSFYLNRGLILIFPLFTLIMFMLIAANIAAPPTINLISEIFLMVRIIGFDVFIFVVFPLGSFLGAVFSIFMYSYTQHGRIYWVGLSFILTSFREIHCLVLHIFPVNLLVLNVCMFLSF